MGFAGRPGRGPPEIMKDGCHGMMCQKGEEMGWNIHVEVEVNQVLPVLDAGVRQVKQDLTQIHIGDVFAKEER